MIWTEYAFFYCYLVVVDGRKCLYNCFAFCLCYKIGEKYIMSFKFRYCTIFLSKMWYRPWSYISSKPMFPLFLQLPEKGPTPKWTIYKHVSDKSKKCLTVILEFCLSSSVVYSSSTAYNSVWPEIFTKSKVYYPSLS